MHEINAPFIGDLVLLIIFMIAAPLAAWISPSTAGRQCRGGAAPRQAAVPDAEVGPQSRSAPMPSAAPLAATLERATAGDKQQRCSARRQSVPYGG
jgi:hypothetical protein